MFYEFIYILKHVQILYKPIFMQEVNIIQIFILNSIKIKKRWLKNDSVETHVNCTFQFN